MLKPTPEGAPLMNEASPEICQPSVGDLAPGSDGRELELAGDLRRAGPAKLVFSRRETADRDLMLMELGR